MREILSSTELVAAAGGDAKVLWAGQGMTDGTRAWYAGDALAVVAPDLSRHDRIVVRGPVDQAAALVREVLGVVGTAYRPFGDEELVRGLVERIPELSLRATFGWMEIDEAPASALNAMPFASGGTMVVETVTARWLADDAGVAELLDEASPTSYARPGDRGVLRWAGVEDPTTDTAPVAGGKAAWVSAPGDGSADSARLLSVAADAWSAPEVGFLAGVATLPTARGRGLSKQVCAFVTAELVKRHGRVALMVDGRNDTAIGLYRTLGYSYHPVGAAQL
ncbi:GNAT family N-acetyltransferase [Kribbella sp. DT2]|uniref:GNAT family N-acetyltransferase n=1 Tax=Kribbella sp. DT2 TaxID=3393427 RepID=UPI003CF88C71